MPLIKEPEIRELPPKKLVGIDISIEFLKIAQNDLKGSGSYSKEESHIALMSRCI